MPNSEKILVVEDETTILRVLGTILAANGYQVITAETGQQAVTMASSHCPDLILLDLGLPGMDGLEVIKKLRQWSGTPILVVSARDEEDEKVRAFDLGADDYITKPFGTSELLARIRAARRHANQLAAERAMVSSSYEYKDFKIDFERRTVTIAGKEIHLTQNEYKIVERFNDYEYRYEVDENGNIDVYIKHEPRRLDDSSILINWLDNNDRNKKPFHRLPPAWRQPPCGLGH